MSNVRSLTDAEFDAARKSPGAMVLDFYADWCSPCKAIAPLVDRVAERNPSVLFGKVNIDLSPTTASEFGVRSIPTLVFLRDGREWERIVGTVSERIIESTLNRVKGD